MAFNWVKKVSAADIITLGNGFLGFIAITLLLDGGKWDILTARILILTAILMDGADGAVARHFGSKHDFGRHLDSIADTMSFCIAPALLVYRLYYEKDFSTLRLIFDNSLIIMASTMVFFSGIIRLARFVEDGHELKYFSGSPTPATAFFLITLSFFHTLDVVEIPMYVFVGAALFISILMVSEVRYPKFRGRDGLALAPAGLVAAFVPFLEMSGNMDAAAAAVMLLIPLAIILTYIIGGPFFVRKKDR